MKNSVDSRIEEICFSPEKLKTLITKKLSDYRPRTYLFSKETSVPAAVLIPLFFKNDQVHLLFTKRTERVAHHKGQISFPGGRKDDSDRDMKFTALRETEEEVGIKPEHIRLLGRTDRFLTNTFFLVSPFVGWFEYPYPFVISEDEIDRLIEVPLLHLLQPDTFEVKPLTKNGQKWMIHYYHYKDDIIWGVTGFLLSNFLSLLFDEKRPDVFRDK